MSFGRCLEPSSGENYGNKGFGVECKGNERNLALLDVNNIWAVGVESLIKPVPCPGRLDEQEGDGDQDDCFSWCGRHCRH